MKRTLALIGLLALLAATASTEPWIGKTITLTPGTAIRLSTNNIQVVSSFIVQMQHGCTGCGVGYLLYAPLNVTCSKGANGTVLIAELQAGTAAAPGGNVTVPSNPDPQGGVNLANYCVDGAQADPVGFAANLRN